MKLERIFECAILLLKILTFDSKYLLFQANVFNFAITHGEI